MYQREYVLLFISQCGGCIEGILAPDPCQTAEHNVICLLGHFTTVLLFEVFRAQLEGSVHLSHCKVKEAQAGKTYRTALNLGL